jgi:hypothetical protein
VGTWDFPSSAVFKGPTGPPAACCVFKKMPVLPSPPACSNHHTCPQTGKMIIIPKSPRAQNFI